MRLPFTLLLIAATCHGFAQTNKPITIDPGIGGVTVYLNGGEVRSSVEVDLPAGLSTVVLTGLSNSTYTKSVQVAIKGELTILSVNADDDGIKVERAMPRIGRLQDSLRSLNARVVEVNDRIGASQAAKDMLARNYDIGGGNTMLTAEALAKTADFFQDRTLKLNRAISTAAKEKMDLEEEQRRIRKLLDELEDHPDIERKKVVILLNAERALHTRIDLRYLVGNTGWSPTYDLVAKDNTQPIIVRYKAQVYNNTGIDWKKMKLTLSTADPSLGASVPELTRWELGGNSSFGEDNDGGSEGYQYNQGVKMNEQAKQDQIQVDPSQRYEEITVSEVTAEFKIARTYDVPSDAKPYMVEIAEHSLPAEYRYAAIPKLDQDAFLLARITGWEELDLVDGPANVYFQDSYVGESMLRTAGIDDTLDLSLGRDNNIQVKRVELEDKTSRKIIGSERKQTMSYEITVKNNSTGRIHLVLRDQVPVSKDDQIKVEVLELSGGSLDGIEGSVEWPLDLEPGASTKVLLSFSIRHPRGWNVKYRTRIRRQKILF